MAYRTAGARGTWPLTFFIMGAPAWYKPINQQEDEKDGTQPSFNNLLDTPDEITPQPITDSNKPSWYSEPTTESGTTTQTSTPEWYKPTNLSPEKEPGSKFEGNFYDALGAASKYAIQKQIKNKSIPKGVFDDAALGIGKIQGWCGVYASRISTASKVGDSWAEKKTHIDKRQGIKAGDKILIPLGVDKKGNGYGHVMVAMLDEDEEGNFPVAQSNADGRQNRGEGEGVATYGIYNTNELNKRYGTNWGAASGKLKVNAFADKKVGAEIMKGAAKPVPVESGNDTSVKTGMNLEGGFYSLLGNAAVAAIENVKSENAQKPPGIDDADYSPQALAKWVIDNGVTDLKNKKWWQNSPAKDEAWKLIMKAQGTNISDKYVGGTSLSQGPETSPMDNIIKTAGDILDPNSLWHTGSTDNQIAQRANIVQNFQKLYSQGGGIVGGVVDHVNKAAEAGNKLKQNAYDALIGKKVSIADVYQNARDVVVEGGSAALTIATIVPEAVISLLPRRSDFGQLGQNIHGIPFRDDVETVMNLPNVGVEALAKGVGALAGANVDSADFNKNVIEPLQVLTNVGLVFGGGALHKGAKDAGIGLKELITTKEVKVPKVDILKALEEITTGKSIEGAKPNVVQAMRDIINMGKEAADQKAMLKKSITEGIRIREARNFTQWFQKYFKGVKKGEVPQSITALIESAKKVASGERSIIEFTKEAREVLIPKGESAVLRDAGKDVVPSGEVIPESRVAEETRLNELKEQGKQEIVKVEANNQDALSINTYTYSDGKVGIGFNMEVDGQSIQAPINGAYVSPKEALKEILPTIEKAVAKGSDVASEAIRTEIHKLQEEGFKSVPDQGEIMPWEDNYTPPKEIESVKTMSREEIQREIDTTVDEYIKTALNEGKGQGVTQGGLIRDPRTGDVIGRTGRVSNNPDWYRNVWKENGGRRPTKAQLREIAIDHLTNGVSDSAIGEMPGNKRFKALVQQLPNAKIVKPGDIVNPLPKTENSTKPIQGTGDKAVRGLALSVENMAVEKGLLDRMSDLPEYKTVNMKDQAEKAQEIISKNPEKARKIAMGEERPPEGVLPEAVFVAVEKAAIEAGDVETLTQLARNSGLTAEATTMGQRLRTLAERDPESPVGAFESVIRAREQALEKRLAARKNGPKTVKAAKEKIVKEIKESIQKKSATKQDWGSFIDSLEC